MIYLSILVQWISVMTRSTRPDFENTCPGCRAMVFVHPWHVCLAFQKLHRKCINGNYIIIGFNIYLRFSWQTTFPMRTSLSALYKWAAPSSSVPVCFKEFIRKNLSHLIPTILASLIKTKNNQACDTIREISKLLALCWIHREIYSWMVDE